MFGPAKETLDYNSAVAALTLTREETARLEDRTLSELHVMTHETCTEAMAYSLQPIVLNMQLDAISGHLKASNGPSIADIDALLGEQLSLPSPDEATKCNVLLLLYFRTFPGHWSYIVDRAEKNGLKLQQIGEELDRLNPSP